MIWNYRVVRRSYEDGVLYGIYEAYYDDDDDGKVTSITENPIPFVAESLDELEELLVGILQVARDTYITSILNYEDFDDDTQ